MVRPEDGTTSVRWDDPADLVADLERLFVHPGGGTPTGPYVIKSRCREDRFSWGESEHRVYAGVPHNNANKKKKSKRKQAQKSRRRNRG